MLTDRLSLSGDAAYVSSHLNGHDHRLLRPSINPLPENGSGSGLRLHAVLDCEFSDAVHVGIGAR